MGAGLSMTSVNKIKELANSREYSLALELVEHQDLTKSLNPQFLRLCGEIYIKNNRYADARRCLLMAHRLAPESKRIIYTFVELYLRMGYFRLAKTYYDMYMFDASAYDSREIEYIWNKHEHPEEYGSLDVLLDGYMHNLDYEWSFELYLLYKKEGKQKEADTLAELYHASYQNSEYSQIIADIESGKTTADAYFDVYAAEEQPDDDPDLESLRMEEKELLDADDLRMHPKEAEITVMYEDSYTPAGSEKKVQKMLKKQEREEQRKEKKLQKKLKQQEKAEAETTAAEINAEEENVSAVTESNMEEETTTVGIEAKTEKNSTATVAESGMEVNETATEEKQQNDETEKKLTEPEQTGTAEKKDDEDVQAKAVKTENTEKAAAFDEFWNAEDDEAGKPKEKKSFFDKFRRKKKSARGETEDIEKKETEQEDGQKDTSEKIETADEKNIVEQEETKNTEDTTIEIKSEESNIESSSENIETTGQADDMIHRKNIISKDVVVVDEDDGFEAEAETVEELEAQEQSKIKNESSDTATTVSKPAFEFQMVNLAPEDFDDEYQVDDFSEKIDEEFGEMKTVEAEKPFDIGELIPEKPKSDKVEETVEAVEENEETVEKVEEPAAEETEETVEAVEETEETVEEVKEPAAEEIVEIVEEVEEPVVEETVEEVEEPEAEETEEIMEAVEETEETVEEVEEPVVEETKETVEEVEESAVEETVEEVEEPAAEETEETVEEVEELVVEETEETVKEVEKAEVEKPEMEEAEEKTEFRVAPFTTKPEKKKLAFPVFKSSLFPDYHKETKVVENNFNEIMEEARDKITENMRKEEQMQREAEALLATLGISMDSIPATPKTAEKEEQPVQKGPSRDELKASLKIDTVKKNLLKHVKEYR